MKKILTVCTHTGSANSLSPLIKSLENENIEVVSLAEGPSQEIFDRAKIVYKTLKDYSSKNSTAYSVYQALRQENPSLVVTGISVPSDDEPYVLEQKAILASAELKMSSLTILDFWTDYLIKFGRRTNEPLILADKITVLDGIIKSKMIEQGFPEERLYVTGSPVFDKLIGISTDFTQDQKEKVRRELGARKDSYLMTFCAQSIK